MTERARGCDLSHLDGTIDFHRLKDEGLSFVGLKATDGKIVNGSMFVDPAYSDGITHARHAGLRVFSYHYFRPTSNGVGQAQHFLRTAGGLRGQMRPALDLELDDNERPGVNQEAYIHSALAFVAHVEDRLKVKPMIYTYPSFWEWLGNPTDFADCPLWVADYNHGTAPRLFGGWKTWTVWQTTDQGTAAGISGVDLDVWNGDEHALAHYLMP